MAQHPAPGAMPQRPGKANSPPMPYQGPPGGPPVGPPGGPYQQPPSHKNTAEFVTPPPENTWPCGCAYPGQHKVDCMWSLWEQMRDNYSQTKKLMSQFMTQVDTLQSGAGDKDPKCKCPSSCHGRDLGEAMGLQQMQGVTVPWLQPPMMGGLDMGMGVSAPQVQPPTSSVGAGGYMSESRKLMEEQRRIKNTWAQFLNIFDMALDLANDVSKDRWEAVRRRKERERLERQQRKEEERQLRQERREKCAEDRAQASKPSQSSDKDEQDKEKNEKLKKEAEKKEADKEKGKKEPPKKKTEDDEPPEENAGKASTKRSVFSRKESPPPAEQEEPPAETLPDEGIPEEAPAEVEVEEPTKGIPEEPIETTEET